MDVSKYRGTSKSSILIGFSIIYHPFWGTPIFGNTHMENMGMEHSALLIVLILPMPFVWRSFSWIYYTVALCLFHFICFPMFYIFRQFKWFLIESLFQGIDTEYIYIYIWLDLCRWNHQRRWNRWSNDLPGRGWRTFEQLRSEELPGWCFPDLSNSDLLRLAVVGISWDQWIKLKPPRWWDRLDFKSSRFKHKLFPTAWGTKTCFSVFFPDSWIDCAVFSF